MRKYHVPMFCCTCSKPCKMAEPDADGIYDSQDRPWCEKCAAIALGTHNAEVCMAENDMNDRLCSLHRGHSCPHASEGMSWTDFNVPQPQHGGRSMNQILKGRS